MDDNRLRGFSPPPWAALGRRDPEHEQAPWRESENVEDRRQMGWGDYLSAKANQVGHTVAAVPDVISAMGTRPASDELMQRYMEEISRILPQEETPRMGPNDKPFYYAGRAEGGAVEGGEPERGLLERAWDARPWKDQLNKPVDYAPLSIALGLLHPRLGGATRDLGMATQMARQGSAPAAMRGMPEGMPAANATAYQRPPAPMGMRQGVANSNKPMAKWEQFEAHLANLERQGVPYEQFPSWRAFFRDLDGKAEGGVVPTLDVDSDLERVERRSSQSDGSIGDYMRSNGRNKTIDALLDSGLSAGSVALGATMGMSPVALIPYGHAVYRGARALDQFHDAADYYRAGSMWDDSGLDQRPDVSERRADGGPVKPQPSFSEPLSGFIDKTLDGVRDYGRGAMEKAGWAPWAKGAGEVAMGVAATPFEAVSSASKLAMAPADWATGRKVMASPWDVVGALPLAATGGLKALRHALDVSDLKRGARAAEDFLTTKRDRGDFLPADLRIKQIIDEMAARRNMD